ncbi:MAG: DUF342 domain-containing protein [Thermacetogeniaceae bacterium]
MLIERECKEGLGGFVAMSFPGGEREEGEVGKSSGEGTMGENCDATAEVKNGRVYVRGPRGSGRPAVLIPAQGVVVRVNGVIVNGPHQVHEGDKIEVEAVEEVRPAEVEVEISKDGYSASVRVTPQVVVRYELVDQGPQNALQLLTRRHMEETKVVTVSDVEKALREKGVVYGVDLEEIARAVAAADGEARIVARGEPVQEGRDGWVEYFFSSEPVKIVYGDDSNVDYWERYVIPSVAEGDVLAVVHPPVPGVPGRKVTGERVEPRPVREVRLRAKDGVVLEDGGRKAVAAVAGRPVLEGSREPGLRVEKVLVHPGDVDFKTGNVTFVGDITILGSVKEGMRVSAKGDITVMGNITGAVVKAGGKVMCQGKIINSKVYAGGLRSFYARLYPLLKTLINRLDELVKETVRISAYAEKRGSLGDEALAKIISLLVEKRRKEISELVKKCSDALSEAELPISPVISEFTEGVKELLVASSYLGAKDASVKEKLRALLGMREELVSLLDSMSGDDGDIICSYAQNSTLNAGGSIVLTGKGGYFSNLIAGRDVRIRGVFRGGEITSMGNVYADEVGTPAAGGGRVSIRVVGEGTVYLNKAYPETSVQIMGRFYCFEREQSCVRVSLKEGEIMVEPI